MATLVLEDIRKSFGDVQVLHGIDLSLNDGEMVVIVGASGCGKSTLLRIVAGLETSTSGVLKIDGQDVTYKDASERDIAMVFQNYALYPHMTVFDNMAYGLKIRGVPKAEIRKRVEETAKMLELGALLDRRPRQLSGGQRQRVAMGRAVVREPKLFLFDEPLSNLDAKLRVQMRAEIRRLQKRLGVTSLFVTHDQVEAMTLGDRLVVMHKGRPAQIATPMEIWSRPADTYVAGFIGAPSMNFLSGKLMGGGSGVALDVGPKISFADGKRAGDDGLPLTIGIRPEHLTLCNAGEGLALMVDLVEPLGSETLVHGKLPDGETMTVKLQDAAPVAGALVHVGISAMHLHVFDAESTKRMEPVSMRVAV